MCFGRFLSLVLLTTSACALETEKSIEDESDEGDRVDDTTDSFGDATTGGTTDGGASGGGTTDGGASGGGTTDGGATDGSGASGGAGSAGGTDADGSGDDPDGDIGGIDGDGAFPDVGGDTDGPTGDGVFDVDRMYVLFNGAYRDGLSTTGTYIDDAGEIGVADNYFQFVWIDSADYAGDPDEYICTLTYKIAGAAEADFTELGMPESAYMQFLMDLPGSTPTTSGDCEGAAMAFGIDDVTAFAEATPWGFGYGPMTGDFELELTTLLDDFATLDDRPGTTYLRWQNADGDTVTAWGYFQVIPFVDDDSSELDLDLSTGEDPDYLGGVSDFTEPSDGFFSQSTVYLLTFAS